MSKKYFTTVLVFIVLYLTACGGGNTSQKVEIASQQGERIVFGVAQKGPVIEGGIILVYELGSKAERTGKILQTSTSGKQGDFAFKPPVSWSGAVEVIFSGRYFNEATGSVSSDTASLSTIVLLQDNTQALANINIISTMVAARVRSLLRQNKLSFQEAILSASTSIKSIAGVSAQRANTVNIMRNDASQDSAVVLFLSGIIGDLAKKYNKPTQLVINQLASNFAIDGQLSGVAERWDARLKNLALHRERSYTDKYSSYLSRYTGGKVQVPTSDFLPRVITFTSRPVARIDANLSVEPGASVTLDGSKSESDNNKPIKFTWFHTDHGKDRLKLKERFDSKLRFVVPNKENITMQLTLLLSDHDGMTDTKTVRVTTAKFKPSIDDFIVTDEVGNSVNNTIFVNEGHSFGFKLQVNNPIGGEIKYRLLSAPSYGEVSFPPTGEGKSSNVDVSYTHHGGEERADAFVFEVVDDLGNTGSLRIDVIVSPINDAPTAKNDSFQVIAGEILEGNVLLNDSDDEGDELTVSLIGEGLNLSKNGDFTYNSSKNISEIVEKIFQYELSDGKGGISNATITIIVSPVANNNPVANDDSYSVQKNKPIILNVLENDTDSDGDNLAFKAINQPAHGTVVISDPFLKYTPTIGFSGSDSFTYTVKDSRLGQDSASVQIEIINTRPEATSQELRTDQNIPLNFVVTGVDADGDVLTFKVPDSTVSGGELTNNSGSVSYTPPNNFSGEDSFSFRVNDGEVPSLAGTVTITVEAVNQKPIAVITGLPESIYEGKALTLDASSSSSQNGSIVSYLWTSPDGEVTTSSSPSFLYTMPALDDGVSQELTFSLVVIDNLGLSSESVEVSITAHDLPNVFFSPISYTVTEGGIDSGSAGLTDLPTSGNIDASTSVINVTVKLSGANNGSTKVSYRTVDGSVHGDGSEGSDYIASNGTLIFSDTVDTATISISIVSDFDSENGSEFFHVELFNAMNTEIVGSRATINIIDDDSTEEHTLLAINPVFTFVTNNLEDNVPINLFISGEQLATDSYEDNLSVENCTAPIVTVSSGSGAGVELSIVGGGVQFGLEERSCFVKAKFTCTVVDDNGLSVDSTVTIEHIDNWFLCA